jgi:hypothetical protein
MAGVPQTQETRFRVAIPHLGDALTAFFDSSESAICVTVCQPPPGGALVWKSKSVIDWEAVVDINEPTHLLDDQPAR